MPRKFTKYTKKRKFTSKRKVDTKQNRAIAKIRRMQYTKVYSLVRVNDTALGPNAGGAAVAYIQPISCALEQSTLAANQCSDNKGVSLVHVRKFLWGANTWAGGPNASFTGCSGIRSTFCQIQYRLRSTEPTMNQVIVAVIQPRKAFADQIVENKQLMSRYTLLTAAPTYGPAAPGSQGTLTRDMDYSLSGPVGAAAAETIFGCKFNPQLWKVHYYRKHNMIAPTTSGTTNQVGITNTWKAPNDQFGSIKLKLNTYLRAGSVGSNLSVDGHTNFATNAQYTDIPREETRYLVCISNDDTSTNSITISNTQTFTHHLYNNNIVG